MSSGRGQGIHRKRESARPQIHFGVLLSRPTLELYWLGCLIGRAPPG